MPVRDRHLRTICKMIKEYYPERITTDFETNKKLLMEVTDVSAKSIRNRIAGLLVSEKKKEGRKIYSPYSGKMIRKRKKNNYHKS